ncbi:MAG: pyruvate kinase [Campylobacterota bacterium]|nr:pyruvate kinase [Campylobacterota bacterium]
MNRSTKILATIGPASDSLEQIKSLINAGANMFRLNFSHGTHQYHFEVLQKIRTAMKSLDKVVGILQDISGPKVRIGMLEHPFELKKGDEIRFVSNDIVGKKLEEGIFEVSINYPELLSKVQLDEYIYLYDGSIRAKVVQSKPYIKAVVENSGTLGSKKGINFPNTVLDIDVITKKDEKDIAWGVENKVDYFAISFVQNAQDMINAKKLLHGYDGKLIAKIEKFDAVENIDKILENSDGIMVARGDLGIEVPYYDVPTIQKTLIKKANIASKPVITATQMLLSMTTNERATRAEISDVANAVLDGTDVVMLSEESAVGDNPTNAVQTMSNIIIKTEEIYNYKKQYDMNYLDTFDVIQATATKLADDINALGILSLTSSGSSTLRMSRYRPKTPIFAFGHNKKILPSLCMVWGVTPVAKIKEGSTAKMFKKMLNILDEKGILDRKGPYITTIGYPVGQVGNTNTIKILNESDISFYLNYI